MNISDVQLLIFEIGSGCNLGGVHRRCPNSLSEERYAALDTSVPLDDHTILDTTIRFYRDYGFKGMVGWHYYCEPLLYQERMFGLMARIRKAVPGARFLLWTNGVLIPEDTSMFSQFSSAFVTDYGGEFAPRNLAALKKACPNTTVQRVVLDERLQGLGETSTQGCQRPYTEFIVDAYGNVHFCCIDWRGLASPGNIMRDGLFTCVTRWQTETTKIVATPMPSDAPEPCLRCPMRFAHRSSYA